MTTSTCKAVTVIIVMIDDRGMDCKLVNTFLLFKSQKGNVRAPTSIKALSIYQVIYIYMYN